jgi:hypothetical protein
MNPIGIDYMKFVRAESFHQRFESYGHLVTDLSHFMEICAKIPVADKERVTEFMQEIYSDPLDEAD